MEKLKEPLMPTESRDIIIGLLDKGDLISIAGVSRYSRNCLLPRLFETVCLRFSFPRKFAAGDENEEDSPDDRDGLQHRRAKEVLERMVEPRRGGLDVAPYVRELRIMVVDELDEYCSKRLLLALKRLRGLVRFSWTGRTIPDRIVQSLAGSARRYPISLNMAFQPSIWKSEGIGISEAIKRSRDIQEITLVDDRQEYDAAHGNFSKDAARALLDKRWTPLKKLSLCGTATAILDGEIRSRGIPHPSTNLTHLVIGLQVPYTYEDDWPGIKTLLQSASALESLTFLNASSLIFLPLGKRDLPKLKELKVGLERYLDDSCDDLDMPQIAKTLHDFVLIHSDLCRFDFMMWITWQDYCGENNFQENAEWFSRVIDAVCSLRQLTALGLTFPGLLEKDMQAAVDKVVGHEQLKRTCRALRLGGLTDIPMQIPLTGFSRCSFFAASNGRPMENTKSRYEPPSIERLVSVQSDCRLDQVCLNGRLYDILSADTDENKVVVKRWDIDRVQNREESDFYRSDGYWLMKYRSISEDYEVARRFGEDSDNESWGEGEGEGEEVDSPSD